MSDHSTLQLDPTLNNQDLMNVKPKDLQRHEKVLLCKKLFETFTDREKEEIYGCSGVLPRFEDEDLKAEIQRMKVELKFKDSESDSGREGRESKLGDLKSESDGNERQMQSGGSESENNKESAWRLRTG